MRKNYFGLKKPALFSLAVLLGLFMWTGANAQVYITSFPYGEDFESFPTQSGCPAPYVLPAASGWENDVNDGGTNSDYYPWSGTTGSSNTGPTVNGGADHNPGIGGGKYLFTETSCGTNNSLANRVFSPYLDLSGIILNNFFADFWYHRYGSNVSATSPMYVEVHTISGGLVTQIDTLETITTTSADVWLNSVNDLSMYLGDTIRFAVVTVTGTGFGSDMALDDFSFYSLLANDAGVTAITSPANPISAGTPLPVEVTITNFGFDTLYTVNIGWSVNGAVQTPVTWNDTLATNMSDGPISLGTYTFNTGLSTICSWTSMPNGVIDSLPGNDTTCITVCTPLSGVYTLGGVGADFMDFAELAGLLGSCGVDSHVIVNVNPGTYFEEFNPGPIPGNADTATILIDGGDTTMARIVGATNATIALYGVHYTTIRNLTIQSTATTDGYGVQLNDTASWNTIDSCHIMMVEGLNLADLVGVNASNSTTSSYTEGQNAFWTTVSNCRIDGGEMGIHFEGQFGNPNWGNVFMNNHLVSQEDYGFYMDDQDSLTIWGNTIEGLRGTFADGIYCFDIMEFNISYNTAMDVPDWGIYIADGNFDFFPTSRAKVNNNMVSSLTDYAFYIDDFSQTDIWHNTFYNQGTFSGAMRMNDGFDVNIQNNIFWSDGDYAFESDDATSGMTSLVLDYNVYYTTSNSGTKFVDDGFNLYATLALWQAANSFNVNSVEGDPVAVSETDDLHMLGIAANDVGNNAIGITVDIDGDTRPQSPSTTVDIGADEYTPLNDDAAMVEILSPTSVACGDSFTVVMVSVRSLGQDTIFAMAIDVAITGDITQTLNYTYTDTLAFNEIDTVIVGTVNTYAGGNINLSASVTLVGDQNASNDTVTGGSATFTPFEPQGMDGYGCGTDSAYLYGAPYSGVQYQWYANQNDTVPIAVGDSFLVPSITGQSTYWLQYNSQQDSQTTTFAGGNGQVGNMFDIVALQSTQILSFAGNMNAGTHATVKVWYRPNSYTNSPAAATGWTLVGTANNVVSNGNGVPTQIPVPVNITIPAGQTYGWYIEYSSSCAYTNGSTVQSVYVQNSYFQFLEGIGKAANFASTFSPRIWNGVIYYGSEGCSDIKTAVTSMSGQAAMVNLGADTTYCDTMATLDAGTPSAQWWNWNNGDMTQMSTVNTTGNYWVTIKDTNNCWASDSVNVTIAGFPPSIALGADTLLCDGNSVSLDAGGGFSSYNWSSGGSSQTETVSAAGTVTVTGTDADGCTSSDDIVITTLNTPTAAFTSDTTATGCPDFDFTDTSSDSPTTWSWDFGDGTGTSTVQNPSYTYPTDTNLTYTVTLTVGNACGTNQVTGTVSVDCAVGFDDPLLGNAVRIYPNPNNGQFQIELDAQVAGDYELRVVSVYGQELFAKVFNNVSGLIQEDVDMKDAANGVYFVEVTSGAHRVVYKVVIK